MTELLGSIWWLIVSLGVLVTFHEFGHYWVARRCGVRVLRFSVGFGKALWSRRGRDGTEYVIAAIPLGGYVKMLDEREGEVPDAQLGQAFNRKSVWKRIAIVAAGPIANLLLCVALLWAMFVIGRPDYAPVVGSTDGIAAEAGLQAGDRVLAVGERETPTWSDLQLALIPAALDRADVELRVRDAAGRESDTTLPLSALPADFDERRIIDAIGLVPRHLLVPPVIGRVAPDTAAWGVLAEGDRITAIDGHPVQAWNDIGPLVQQLGERDGTAMVEVERDGDRLALELAPTRIQPEGGGEPYWALGVSSVRPQMPPMDAELRHGPLAAVPAALRETVHQAGELVSMIGRAFTGRVEVENTVAGPITIARAANAYADQGPAWYLSLLAMLSLSLGILNLLPIPILDGGHLLYYLIELVKGSPVSERTMAVGQYVGLLLIVGLMGLAFYNDIVNNLMR
ncbi:zinc metalloprotease [Lysobacter arseniciresistens ZS79]|uniref:Zinc metalloprotease n=1 Tax=Lysobacter arseniciresistens ZS79 TaxID=913325 RepID=A0A0A0F1M6_9GAMM|nr:RIP metalloprotease RseP [Lysobacter arseniciresistens]KGM57071.1 zinc metalloprotease [Lysobacter arseniciresistens ZS79]